MKIIQIWNGEDDLDKVAESLAKLKAEGKNVSYYFYGTTLNSLSDDLESCYQKVLGCSRAQFKAEQAKFEQDFDAEKKADEARAKAKIPEWIERGNKLVYPEKQDRWKECVDVQAREIDYGADLEIALEIMEMIDKGKNYKQCERYVVSHTKDDLTYYVVMSIIADYSKKGPDFYKFMEPKQSLEPETKSYLQDLEIENAKFAQNASQLGR